MIGRDKDENMEMGENMGNKSKKAVIN